MPKGQKQCEACKEYMPARSQQCPHCNHKLPGYTEKEVKPFEPQYFHELGKGRKKCPACLKIIGARLTQCYCSHVFEIQKDIPEYFDGPGPRRRLCEGCNKYISSHRKICYCGAAKPEVIANRDNAGYEVRHRVPFIAMSYMGDRFCTVMVAPGGKCPIPLKQFDSSAIKKWVEEMIDVGLTENKLYSWNALQYYLRQFVDFNSPEFKEVCALMTESCVEEEVAEEMAVVA